MWIDYFNAGTPTVVAVPFPNADFWEFFIQQSIGSAIKDKLAHSVVMKCEELNQYSLYTLTNVADYFSVVC